MVNFDEIANRWDTPSKRHRSARIAQAMRSKIGSHFGADHLPSGIEYGSGTGQLGIELVDQFSSLTFIDTSAGMIEQAEAKICDLNLNVPVTAVVGSAEEEPLPGLEADVIFSSLAFHHIAHTKALLKNLRSMLRPGGLLLVVDLDEDGGDFHGHHRGFDGHHGFNRDDLVSQTQQAGFTEVQIEDGPPFRKQNSGREFTTFLLSAAN